MDDSQAREIESKLAEKLREGSGELMNIAFSPALFEAFVRLGFIKDDDFKKTGFPGERLTVLGYRGHVALLNKTISPEAFLIGEGGYDAQGS